MNKNTKANFGIDAPGLCQFFFFGGLAALVVFAASLFWLPQNTYWVVAIESVIGIAATYLLGMGCLMVYDSKVTKITTRDQLLNTLEWRGDEMVLDVGCGRGLMAVGAAQRLTTGKAIGVDIWQGADQSANTPEGAIENARLAKVSDRVEIKTADMRSLPFPDCAFDVVLSAWAVHNLDQKSDRELALNEMMRVLKIGGFLILSDIEHRDTYAEQLRGLGLTEIKIIFAPLRDKFLNLVSFGSYRPSAITGRKPF
jgi:arsenite methyltransferase